jgi:O-antigen ligase
MGRLFSRATELFIEYGIYIYLIIMFLNKGESIKNIVLYGAFALWLLSGKWRDRDFYRSPLTILFGGYLFSVLLSVVFSIDPEYSLISLKYDILKAVVLFPVLATSFSTEQRLRRLSISLSISASIMIAIGFYSYLTQDISFLKPNSELMHAWHNRFARYLCLTMPFAMILLLTSKNKINMVGLFSLIIFGSLAVILSTSRGGMFALVLIVTVWILFVYKKGVFNFRKIILISLITFITMFFIGLSTSPALKTRLGGMESVNLRLDTWNKALESIKQRPILGWGYGKEIFHREEPYLKTTDKSLPKTGPENTFIQVLFHQGLVGLGVYISLILTAIVVFFRSALRTENSLRSYVLITACGIIVGNHIGHSLVAAEIFRGLAIILAIGIATEKGANLINKKDGSAEML